VRLAWWPDERHDVSWHQAPSHGFGEGAVQDGVQVADGGGGQSGRKFLLVEPLEVLWGEQAEATVSRCLAEDGYLSARQLSVDLRQAAAWLAVGAQFGV
jgi:hypothetical protein